MIVPALLASALASPCPPLTTGDTLAKHYPARIGEEVRLEATVERAIDITTALVVADGERFAVLLTPEHLWTGRVLKTFAVLGSTEVALSGPTRLPHLLLVTEPRCVAEIPPTSAKEGEGTGAR